MLPYQSNIFQLKGGETTNTVIVLIPSLI